ncbi:MAG: histone deacetylase family protein [Alphaproteobacteria bacterium]|nr:histone deacetylase family protein [Alphaproteobacteria bacterium]
MKAFWNAVQRAHAPRFSLQRGAVKPNFEVPERCDALLDACRSLRFDLTAPPAVTRGALEVVHDPDYLDFLRDAPAAWAALPDPGPELVANVHPCPEMLASGARRPEGLVGRLGWYTFDTSCPFTADTWPAAVAAAECALAAAEEAAAGRSAYALARPPGHHAYAARAAGHCFINNAALAAERLRARGAARVAVLDIDSHHGNGTQGIFWERSDVLFVSLHGDPHGYYPWYTGHADERGVGAGAGFNMNLPLPRFAGDDAWLAALDAGLDRVRQVGAEALVLSLGFDASEHEPLRYLSVSEDGFARAGAKIGGLGLPTAIVQEGGYNLALIGRLLERFMGGFGG